jgi:hypothetical protein
MIPNLKFRRSLTILIQLLILLLILNANKSSTSNQANNIDSSQKNGIDLVNSGYWDLTGTSIYIGKLKNK